VFLNNKDEKIQSTETNFSKEDEEFQSVKTIEITKQA